MMKTFANIRLGRFYRIALCLAAAVLLLSSGSLAESGGTWGEPFESLSSDEQVALTAAIVEARDRLLQAHHESAVKSGWDGYPVEITHTIAYEIDSFSDDCPAAKQHKYYCNDAGSPCTRIVVFSTLADYFGFGIATELTASVAFYADGSARVLYSGSILEYVRSRTYENPLCPCMRAIDAGHAFDGVYSTEDAPTA